MKKSVLLLLGTMLLASNAFAILSTEPDNIGMYFDPNADIVCTAGAFLTHIPAYVIYTNPSLVSIAGFELGIDMVGAVNTSVTKTYPVLATDVGSANNGGIYMNFLTGFAVPMMTSPATILCNLDIFFLDFGQVDFYCGPVSPTSDLSPEPRPMIMRTDFSLMAVDTSSMPGEVSAQINAPACLVVDTEDASFGAVKALFR